MTLPSLLAALPGRLAPIIAGLRLVLAERAAKERALAPLVMLLWSRLNEVAKRFASRVQWPEPGLVRRTIAGAPSARRQGSVARASGPRLAGGFAWLVRLVPEAACYGGQLQHLLSDPEVAAAPSAARVLRPLCRMLRGGLGGDTARRAGAGHGRTAEAPALEARAPGRRGGRGAPGTCSARAWPPLAALAPRRRGFLGRAVARPFCSGLAILP